MDKEIKPAELAAIFAAGLRVFPIYETYGDSADYFSSRQGAEDAGLAVATATGYGFERHTTIYFAVDFDALDTDVTDNIVPYFQGIQQSMGYFGNPYKVGVYGDRNVCNRLLAEGLTTTSFVADLSTGFSGNLGTVPLVLFEGAFEIGIPAPQLNYSADELRKIFARYNGTGPEADQYGEEVHGVYLIFDKYNAMQRSIALLRSVSRAPKYRTIRGRAFVAFGRGQCG